MTNLENLAYTKFTTDDSFTTHNVAHLAYHDGPPRVSGDEPTDHTDPGAGFPSAPRKRG